MLVFIDRVPLEPPRGREGTADFASCQLKSLKTAVQTFKWDGSVSEIEGLWGALQGKSAKKWGVHYDVP